MRCARISKLITTIIGMFYQPTNVTKAGDNLVLHTATTFVHTFYAKQNMQMYTSKVLLTKNIYLFKMRFDPNKTAQ